jgi:hypothetical protein
MRNVMIRPPFVDPLCAGQAKPDKAKADQRAVKSL